MNPTWIPLVIHRFFGNFVFSGFAIAAYAGWMLGRRANHPDEPYYLYQLKVGILIGLAALLIQPFTGLFYAAQIRQAAPEAYQQTIQGRYRGLVYLQFILIGLIFIGNYFLLRLTLKTQKGGLLGGSLLILSALLMIAFAEFPAVRRFFTYLLVAVSLFYFFKWRQEWNAAGSEVLNRAAVRRLAMALGLLALFTYWTMGTIRETARRPDTVRGMISLQDEARTPKFLTGSDRPIEGHSDKGGGSSFLNAENNRERMGQNLPNECEGRPCR
jgi:cytochrome bd-type quinol oxidase subunit 1